MFLTEERLEFPDVDSDVSRDDRPRAIQYLLSRYGSDHVSQIITFTEYKLKNTIKAVNTAYGFIPPAEINEITTKIPSLINGEGASYNLIQDIATNPDQYPDISTQEYNMCKQIMKMLGDLFTKYPQIYQAVTNLNGAISGQGIHAGGVVVAGKPLHENLPIMHAKPGAAVLPITQISMEDLDFFKALKIDVLGLQTCTVIYKAMQLAGLPWEWYDNEDFTDQGVFEMLRRGETTDVFQMAKHTPRQMIKDFKCDSLEVLTAINAGNRPGPLAKIDELGGKSMVELYAERTRDPRLIPSIDPRIDEIFAETKGCLWYQEQCQKLGMVMAGYSLGMADLRIRKVLAKKKLKEIPALRNEFIYGKKTLYDEDGNAIGISEENSPLCVGAVNNGFSEEVAKEIFGIMEKFALYAFNKSHSCAYAAISYKTAWLSYHYPVEYAVACMSIYHDKEKILATLVNCRKRGIKILPPDINKSEVGFTVEVLPNGEKAIRFGLAAIHKVGEKAVEFLMKVRQVVGPVSSYDEYYTKYHDPAVVQPFLDEMSQEAGKRATNPLKKDVDVALILSGCFDEFEENRYKLHNHYMGNIRRGKDKGWAPYVETDYIRKVKLALEKEYMGTYVSEHPLEPFPYVNLSTASNNQFVETAGQILDIKKVKGKRGEFGKVKIETKDGTETMTMLFDPAWSKYKSILKKGEICVFSGRFNEQYNNIAVDRVQPVKAKTHNPLAAMPDDLGEVDQLLHGVATGAPVRQEPLDDLMESPVDDLLSFLQA